MKGGAGSVSGKTFMNKRFLELEKKANEAGVYIDYTTVCCTENYNSVIATVSDKDGKRYVRAGEVYGKGSINSPLSEAIQIAGIRAYEAYFGEDVVDAARPVRQPENTTHQREPEQPHQMSRPSGVTRPQATGTKQGGNAQRPAGTNAPVSQQAPQQNRNAHQNAPAPAAGKNAADTNRTNPERSAKSQTARNTAAANINPNKEVPDEDVIVGYGDIDTMEQQNTASAPDSGNLPANDASSLTEDEFLKNGDFCVNLPAINDRPEEHRMMSYLVKNDKSFLRSIRYFRTKRSNNEAVAAVVDNIFKYLDDHKISID